MTIFGALVVEPELERAFLDGSDVRAHQHSAGAASQDAEANGERRGGNTTKIHLPVDGYGLPVEFIITGGEGNDCTAAPALIAKNAIIVEKGYDSESLREQIGALDSRVVIPIKCNSVKDNGDLDRGLYRYRHLVENAFARLKQDRAIATWFDKLKRNYESMVAMACGFLWLPM